MDNIDVSKCLEKVPGFIGVFDIDKLPSKISPGEVLIVNTSPSTSRFPGHFVCVDYRRSPMIYFDSYGLLPWEARYIENMLNRENVPINYISRLIERSCGSQYLYSNKDYQSLILDDGGEDCLCGFYCIMYVREGLNSYLFTERQISRKDLDSLISAL